MNRFLSKDFLSGLMFIGFGLIALYFGQKLALGTPVRMGPGYVPRMLALIIMGLGGIISVVALVSPGEMVEKPKWKPIVMVTIGIVCFALLFERAGLLPALIVPVVLLLFLVFGSFSRWIGRRTGQPLIAAVANACLANALPACTWP